MPITSNGTRISKAIEERDRFPSCRRGGWRGGPGAPGGNGPPGPVGGPLGRKDSNSGRPPPGDASGCPQDWAGYGAGAGG